MVGYLKMDMEQCLKAYSDVFQSMFEKRKRPIPLKFTGKVRGFRQRCIEAEVLCHEVLNSGLRSGNSVHPAVLVTKGKLAEALRKKCDFIVALRLHGDVL